MTLEDFKAKMTLYFSKSTGDIKSFCSGIQDMGYFGENKEDFSQIWDFAIFDFDNYVIQNLNKFIVDLDTKQLKIKQDAVPKYPVA